MALLETASDPYGRTWIAARRELKWAAIGKALGA